LGKIWKELTIGFHGKSADTAGEVVNMFVSFLRATFSILHAEGKGQQGNEDEPLRKLITAVQ